MSGSEKSRKIAVIFVADVVGYSKHMEKDEDATLKAFADCEKILKKLLKKYVVLSLTQVVTLLWLSFQVL